MKAIILLFDSLNKNYLPPYGDLLTKAPNFQRLAAHAATFDNSYVGSMPCMPARRELHTGCSAAIFFAQKRDKFCTVGRCQKDTFCTVQK